jgi:glyoxylase-like metal-dependent hydrolase (beta-lactamase superfamily II)
MGTDGTLGAMSHVPTIHVGRFEIATICEGFAPLALVDELPGQAVDWTAERLRHPWAFHDDATWPWHVHAFLVRSGSTAVLVDTGTGASGPYVPWATADPEAWAGVDPGGIAHVVLSHLHADHAGGATVRTAGGTTVRTAGGGTARIAADAAATAPRFPNAAVHVHPADWAFFADADDEQDHVSRRALRSVETAGALDLDPRDRELVPGIAVRHTPGHTPGHRSVFVRDGDAVLLLTGDLLHLPTQAARPSWPSSHDEDPAAGVVSRVALLVEARHGGWRVGVPHFAAPFGRVGDGGWRSDPG